MSSSSAVYKSYSRVIPWAPTDEPFVWHDYEASSVHNMNSLSPHNAPKTCDHRALSQRPALITSERYISESSLLRKCRSRHVAHQQAQSRSITGLLCMSTTRMARLHHTSRDRTTATEQSMRKWTQTIDCPLSLGAGTRRVGRDAARLW